MTNARRAILVALLAGLLSLGIAAAAQAAGPYVLLLGQGDAFSVLGASCGGIHEESLATGFAANGYPEGDVHLSTTCGGSGRGGGYKNTTYTAVARVQWNWFGETRSFGRLEGSGGAAGFDQTDAHGDRLYDSGTHAYLETGEPPLQPPGAPSAVAASVSIYEVPGGSSEYLRMSVSWTAAAETAGLLTSSTVTATPLTAGPPVLTETVGGNWTSTYLGPVQPGTAYLVTVTSTDAEGTSEASTPVEVKGVSEDGGGPAEPPAAESCEALAGTIKLSPGLSETPHVQNITLKGRLSGCDGPSPIETGSFTAHLRTTGEETCAALSSQLAEATTESLSAVFKWAPREAGSSHGSVVVPITEAGSAPLSGTLSGGPFSAPVSLAGSVYESFAGGPSCGLGEPTKKAKPVKKGSFSGTSLGIG